MDCYMEEQALDEPGTEYEDSVLGSSDGEETQCPEADNLMATLRDESPECSQGDTSPEFTQSDERRQWRQSKQQSKADAFKEAKEKAAEIKKRKSEGECPKPPKKDRSQESSSHVWKIFKEITVEGIPYNECTICRNK